MGTKRLTRSSAATCPFSTLSTGLTMGTPSTRMAGTANMPFSTLSTGLTMGTRGVLHQTADYLFFQYPIHGSDHGNARPRQA